MNTERRNFLKLSGSLAAAIALSPLANKFMTPEEEKSIGKFGLQLWSVRDDLAKDTRGVLKQLSDDGYKQIESFEGAKGMFWGMSHTEFKKYMDELGMAIISSHCNVSADFEKKVAQATEIGMKYLVMPYEGPNKSIDDYKKLAEDFNKNAAVCKKSGIR